MASFLVKHVSLFLSLLAFSSVHVHARESKFFSKISRSRSVTPLEATRAPDALQKEEPHELPSQSHNGYGLYGHHGPEQFSLSPETTTTTTTTPINGFSSRFPNNELANERYQNKEHHSVYSHGSNIPPAFSNEYETKEWKKNYVDDPNKQYYGMSDTRYFLENGKYYYDVDVNGQGHLSRYEPYQTSVRSYNNNGGYRYGNGYSERNNGGMNEYQNNQEYEQENKEEYIP